jgi:hypothetical protein
LDRKVNNYMRLPASLYSVPLIMPAHANPITGEQVASHQLFGGIPIEDLAPFVSWNKDNTEFVFSTELSAEEMFYLAAIGHGAGTDARVMTHSEALALTSSEEWCGV